MPKGIILISNELERHFKNVANRQFSWCRNSYNKIEINDMIHDFLQGIIILIFCHYPKIVFRIFFI